MHTLYAIRMRNSAHGSSNYYSQEPTFFSDKITFVIRWNWHFSTMNQITPTNTIRKTKELLKLLRIMYKYCRQNR